MQPVPAGQPARPVVLLVDDEVQVRALTRRMLEEIGCRVLEAGSVVQALDLVETTQVDLLLTDYRLPSRSGAELARAFAERYPGRPILCATGTYLDDLVLSGALPPGTHLLAKPYTVEALQRAVERVLPRG